METFSILTAEFDTWVPAINFRRIFALVKMVETPIPPLAIDITTVKLQQAQDAGGTGAKDVEGVTITGELEGYYSLSVPVDLLDSNQIPGFEFKFVAVTVTEGTAEMLGLFGELPLILPPPRGVLVDEVILEVPSVEPEPELFIGPPQNLSSARYNRNNIRLEWEAGGGVIATQFGVERQTGMEAWMEIARTDHGVTLYRDIGLEYERKYTYRVRAYAPFGASEYSNKTQRTTGSDPN